MKHRIFLLAAVLAFMGCEEKEQVDLLVQNANVYTVDTLQPKATAFVVADGRFVDVGESEDLMNRYRAGKVIDAATGEPLSRDADRVTVSLYPCQLIALKVY